MLLLEQYIAYEGIAILAIHVLEYIEKYKKNHLFIRNKQIVKEDNMSNLLFEDNYGIKDISVAVFQLVGILLVVLLICLPGNITIISLLLRQFSVVTPVYLGVHEEVLFCIIGFMITYFISMKRLGKYKSTKLFSAAASFFMTFTLVSLILFMQH